MGKWTDDEIAILKEAYSGNNLNLVSLSNRLKRLPSNICRKARLLGLETSYRRAKSDEAKASARRCKGGLTARDEAWLLENYNKYTNREIADFLNRHENYIEKQLRRLKLRKDFKERGWRWRAGHPKGMLGKSHSDELKRQVALQSKKRWRDPNSKLNSNEHRQALSDRATLIQKGPASKTRYSRSKAGARADLGGLYVRSTWEANYARYLNWMKGRGEIKEWFYESNTFDFPVKRGTRFYTPDFKVIENNGDVIYHEIKGWMTQRSQTALNRMKLYYPEIKIILIRKEEYLELSKWKALMPGWES